MHDFVVTAEQRELDSTTHVLRRHLGRAPRIRISLPYLGLIIKGAYMGYPYLKFCLCAFLEPHRKDFFKGSSLGINYNCFGL